MSGMGYRARLGFLLPPGNPTIEPELMALVPPGVSLHFHRMVARGITGSLSGQEERNRMMIDSLDDGVELLGMVKPDVIVIAHTATSYTLGIEGEAALLKRLSEASGRRVVTAFGSVAAALQRLGVERVALGAPYSAETTEEGRAHLEAHRFHVVSHANLKGVINIYDETAERAYALARSVDCAEAQAVFLSGTGMPTLPVLEMLETDLGKPVISSNLAMMWHALRVAGVGAKIAGYGRLLTL
jgi:maleate cis-trans isomerase